MSRGRIIKAYRTLVKGTRPEECDDLTVHPEGGVHNDHLFAIKRDPNLPDGWADKTNFFVCMTDAQMALEVPQFSGEGADRELTPTYLEGLAHRLGVAKVYVQRSQGRYLLTDRKIPGISIGNFATLRELSKRTGFTVDPLCLRMHAWIDGIPAFEELTWITAEKPNQRIMIGTHAFRVREALGRCRAVNANPATGKFSPQIASAIRKMMAERGYNSPKDGNPTVFGVLAQAEELCTIRRGDIIRLA